MDSKYMILVFTIFILSKIVVSQNATVIGNNDETSLSPVLVQTLNQLMTMLNQGPLISIANNSDLLNEQFQQFIQYATHYIDKFLATNDVFDLLKLNISKSCKHKTGQFINGLKANEAWTLKIVDAWGKPSSGIFGGNTFWVGEYSGCLEAASVTNLWETKYCAIDQPLIVNPFERGVYIRYGICVSTECNTDDIVQLINLGKIYYYYTSTECYFSLHGISFSKVSEPLQPYINGTLPIKLEKMEAKNLDCKVEREFYPITIFAIIFVSVPVFIVLVATFIIAYNDYKESQEQVSDKSENKEGSRRKGMWFEVLETMAIHKNAKKIFRINKTGDQFECLHAIRFLSLTWIILGHTYYIGFEIGDNKAIAAMWMKQFFFMIISNAALSVDTFFLMSGFLTSYLFIKDTTKNKLTPLYMVKYYVHRLWRLTPPYLIVLITTSFISRNLGNGPFYPNNGLEKNTCTDHSWWTNLLYINNFLYIRDMCLGVSWYLANDTQFYFVAPLILIPIALKRRFVGVSIAIVFLIGTILSNALILHYNQGYEEGIVNLDADVNLGLFSNVYVAPWCRIGPYIIGILLGYLIFVQKNEKKYPKFNYKLNAGLWFFAIGMCALMLFAIYPDFKGDYLSRTIRIFYYTFYRILWSCGIGFVIYACITKNGGFVNQILSASFWVPLSRLTYAAFLVHFPINRYFVYIMEHPLHLQHISLLYMFYSNLFISYIVAFFVNVFFETPFIGLEKFIFPRKK